MSRTIATPVQLALLLPQAPAVVDGIPGQLDLIGAVLTAELAADAAPQPCPVCRQGCDCDGSPTRLGCGHHGCWGRADVTEALPACPGVAYERARSAALLAGADRVRAARRRDPATYRRVVAGVLADAGLATPDE
jgi:hypothetical protein